jgi:hypothetical protein
MPAVCCQATIAQCVCICVHAGVVVYWIVGLNPAAKAFFIFISLLILQGLAAQGLGIVVSAGVKNQRIAISLAPAVTVVLMLFGMWGGLGAACRHAAGLQPSLHRAISLCSPA